VGFVTYANGDNAHCTPIRLLTRTDMTKALITEIKRYMAQNNLNRGRLSQILGVAPSTVDKLIGGHLPFSDKMLTKIEIKTGINFNSKHAEYDFEVSRPERVKTIHFEGDYQAIRPSFRDNQSLHCYVISIQWSEEIKGLVFEEKQNELSPRNKGVLSIPIYNRMIYLLSCESGNFRLAILSDGYQPGVYYGVMTTVSSEKMIDKIPTSSIFAMKKIQDNQIPCFGPILHNHINYPEFEKLLRFAKDEGFFRVVTLQETPT
jgi:predicted XRE-type DNA-binding protein